jgi:anaerobic selenocysteine-containing dehydrogenase
VSDPHAIFWQAAQMSESVRICPLCEATCGVLVSHEGGQVLQVRGNPDDIFSGGFICPKGVALGELHHDPRRLRTPMMRIDGELRPVGWDEAFDAIRTGLGGVIASVGADRVGVFLGNPNVHNLASTFYLPAVLRALGTPHRYSASTVDQMPKQVASALMFGTPLSVPVPDIDRTDLFVVFGGNPMVSNGSMMTAPDMPGRLRALRKRGGRLIVVDPVRTRTASMADSHISIRPGSDALALAAIARYVWDPARANFAAAASWLPATHIADLRAALEPFTFEAVSDLTGISVDELQGLSDQLLEATSAAVYGRIGTTTSGLQWGDEVVPLATVGSWLIDVINIAIGSLDAPGGVMWPTPSGGGPTTEGVSGTGRGVSIPGRRRTRVRELPSALGEFPASALAEEIDTGDGLRALITVAGNPVLSVPDGKRLTAALGQLDFMVSIDAYVNATTEHADVILPAPSPLTRSHFDVVFNNLAIRNQARYSSPTLPLGETERDEADTLLQFAAIVIGLVHGHEPSIDDVDDLVAGTVAQQVCSDPASRGYGLDIGEVLAAVSEYRKVERILDMRIRSAPFGDGFGRFPDGLTLATVQANPNGIDLGPLQPRLPEVLRTPTGVIELAPAALLSALGSAAELLNSSTTRADLVLVGRRQLRSNNSWMHGLPTLSGGSNQCTIWVHPDDAARLGVSDGAMANMHTSVGSVQAPVSITTDVMPGVVCMPHGWADSSVNDVVSGAVVDQLSATSVLAGMAVELEPING